MKNLRYLIAIVIAFFIITLYVIDFKKENLSAMSLLSSFLNVIFLLALYLLNNYSASLKSKFKNLKKEIGLIISKFIILMFLALVFQDFMDSFFKNNLPETILTSFPIIFLIIDFIEVGKKPKNS